MEVNDKADGTEEATMVTATHVVETGPATVDNPGVEEPKSPAPGLSKEEKAELEERSEAIVKELSESSGSRELQLIDSIGAMGVQTQRDASSRLDLLRGRIGSLLEGEGASSQVMKDLAALRSVLSELSPSANAGISRLLPFSRSVIRRLEQIAVRYTSVSREVVIVEGRLREGRTLMRRDSVELRKLYEEVEAQEVPIERNAYLGEALLARLQRHLDSTTDERRRSRIQSVIFDVATRVQDLRTMQEVHAQFYVSLEMMRDNNARLGQAIDRTLSLTTNTLMVGLAIQAALVRQKRVLEANQRTRQFLGDLILANATSIKQHTAEIGDAYANPVIAIDKLTQAHQELIDALEIAGKIETQGIETARENINRLRELSQGLATRKAVANERLPN